MTPALQRTAPSVPLLAGLRSAHLCEASSRRVPLTYRPAVRLRRPWSSLAGIPSAAGARPWRPPPAVPGPALRLRPPAQVAAGPALRSVAAAAPGRRRGGAGGGGEGPP